MASNEAPRTLSALESCALSTLRGTLVGVAVGAPLSAGMRSSAGLRPTALSALRSSGRLGAAFGAYTAARCGLLPLAGPALAPLLAGALVVMVPTLSAPARYQSNLAALRNALAPVGVSLVGPRAVVAVAASSMASGAVVFGCTDLVLYSLFGLRW